jgi:hypothetical protein
MRVWALWSSRVEMYAPHELIEVFADEGAAEAVRTGLIGKPRERGMLALTWGDDEDFPDLYVRPLEVR